MIRISHYPTMSGDVEFVTTDFDIFVHKPVQTPILETNVVHYKPIATVDQTDFEFSIPAYSETYIDLDIKLYVKGKLTSVDGKDLNATDLRLERIISSIPCSVNVVSHLTERTLRHPLNYTTTALI
jgi:hypothetical protein